MSPIVGPLTSSRPDTRRGWGRVYVDLDTAPRYSVQVPHPHVEVSRAVRGDAARTARAVAAMATAVREWDPGN